jgi:NADH:ubiquinone oxidoreductase subunit 5 (subunit L)/multisubunit Na+/H+ antiporter MnhA subunit
MPKESAEFLDYVDSVRRKEQEKEDWERILKSKQEWRETTYAGMLIALVERTGAAGFFEAIANSLEGGEDSVSFYAVKIIYRIGIITSCIMFVYILGYIFKMLFGDELVIEQEVVIVEEIPRSQYEAEQREKKKRGENVDVNIPSVKKKQSKARQRRGKRD